MRLCPNCNSTFSFISRLRSIEKSVIQCNKCKSIYKMKYVWLLNGINIFLIMTFSPLLGLSFTGINFMISSFLCISIVIIWTYIVFFILSYFIKYEEIEK